MNAHVALHPAFTVLSLCSGGAGLDLGVELAVRGARAVCLVEREAFAVARLVAAMDLGLLAPAPVWSDARTFDGRPWRGLVDCLIGGYPCQGESRAGKRLGIADPRWLWPSFRRIIVQCRPRYLFLENVGAHLTESFGLVRRDLVRLGYTVEAGLFTAAEVGAPHLRERLFILAVADADGSGRKRPRRQRGAGIPAQAPGRMELGRSGGALGDPYRAGSSLGLCRPGDDGEERPSAERAGGDALAAAHRGDRRLHARPGRPGLAPADLGGIGDGLALFPPVPATPQDGLPSPSRSLNPLFVEWLMGWPIGWTACACSATAFTRWQARMRCALSQLGSPAAPMAQLALFA